MGQISAKLTTGAQVEISNGRHTWLADEPPEAGGADTGPNPYELLLSALAACTCVTIAMYCRHKELTLRAVEASFSFRNIHADDCENCGDDRTGFIGHVESRVHISGDFDEAQKERLAQIATRCPVHKTLANGVAFKDNASFD